MIDMLFSVPYLVRILVSLLGILILQKITRSLELALVGGVTMLAVWTGHTTSSAMAITVNRVASADSLYLVLVIVGVIWLSSLMSEAGIMKDLVASLRSRLSKRATLAALPGVVGLLPMPAGALFSAPLIDDADEENHLSQMEKVRINYWFRHVWEFWWPLYPGVLLAVDFSGLAIWKFVLIMMPLYFIALTGGYFFLLRGVHPGSETGGKRYGKAFLPLILPTLTVITVYAFLLVAFPPLARFNKYAPMAVGVLCGIIVIQIQRPATWATWKKVLVSRRTLSLALIVILARVYGAFIEAKLPGGYLLMDRIREELHVFGIPVVALVVLIPFISGLTTGISVGYIGASFPVILNLAGPAAAGGTLLFTVVLGHSCGFLGMMFSPIHVCLMVTNEYFKTNLIMSLAGIIRPAMTVFGAAAVYSFLLLRFV